MKAPQIDIRKDIKELTLRRGEVLTVWLFDGKDMVQVELRVTPDCKPEIFCDKTIIKRYKDWYMCNKEGE